MNRLPQIVQDVIALSRAFLLVTQTEKNNREAFYCERWACERILWCAEQPEYLQFAHADLFMLQQMFGVWAGSTYSE
jgi:hypothetical protein